MIMNNIQWKKSTIDYDKLSELSHEKIVKQINGKFASTVVNKNQGKKNAKNGHMKKIQKIGASLGGKVGGVITRDSGKLKEHSKLGNEANQQKHGKKIIAYNENTEKCWEYISIRECERDLKIQAPIIRKILKGNQPKTRCGWIFEYKK